ncbi:MAG: hypothetical protein JRH20_00410 [Deltaproteobacteria bacterium]|nr:hypothetical protein [Deltaproteobacteria bacterium]
MSDAETGAKALETITLVHHKDENVLLQVELRAEDGGYNVLASRGPRDGELVATPQSDTPIPLNHARVVFDRTVEEAMEQGFEPEYEDDELDLEGFSLGVERGADKAPSLSGLATLAAALGELNGADPKAMLERIAPADDPDEEAGISLVEFTPDDDHNESDESDLPADARVSLEDAANLAAPEDSSSGSSDAGGIDPAQLLGALLGGGTGGAPAPLKRPKHPPIGATPEELCDLALARALERLVKANQVELDPRFFEPLLEALLKVVVAASSPQGALESACKTLMDSDHVEEIYGEDAEIIEELRRAFEEVRKEAGHR